MLSIVILWFGTYTNSEWKWLRIAQKAIPLRHDVVMLVTFTPRYDDVIF